MELLDKILMNTHRPILISAFLGLLLLLTACGSTANQIQSQQTVTINKSFQSKLSPVPSPATYRCGAWSSNNAPSMYATIGIYARLTKDVSGVSGATATAVVHFNTFDLTLSPPVISDSGGYVAFSLSLQGREPLKIPATVDVTFTNFPGGTVHCTPAFFTPQ